LSVKCPTSDAGDPRGSFSSLPKDQVRVVEPRGDAEKFDAGLSLDPYDRVRPGGRYEEVRMIVYRSLLSRFRGRAAEGFA
jgi:hypothetical protein